MKKLSEIASSIIGSARVKPGATGTQLTATGSARRTTFPRPANPFCRGDPLLELPASLRPIVPSGTALLLSWLRFGETPLESRHLKRAIASLEELLRIHEQTRAPATDEEILDALTMIADTIQVELPEKHGLFVYVALLQALPQRVLQEAVLEVMRTHSYRTMPLPAEILAAAPARDWPIHAEWIERLCNYHIGALKRRLEQEGRT